MGAATQVNPATLSHVGTRPQRYLVRSDYVHELAGACQRFVDSTLLLEPEAFTAAARRLTIETPVADSPAEALLTWHWLTGTMARGATTHHRRFHRLFDATDCSFDSDVLPSPNTFARDRVLAALDQWVQTYVRHFDSEHTWPAAVRATSLLQARVQQPWYIEDLARAVGASPATLERSFGRVYGLAAQQYHALLRLRIVATAIRSDGPCIESLILDTGVRSPKDMYRAFRTLTGLTFGAVRHLTEAEFSSLMSGPLDLPIPGLPRGHPLSRLLTRASSAKDTISPM